MKKISIFSTCLVLLGIFVVLTPVESSTIMKKTFEQLVQDSELVFEGRVLSEDVRRSPLSGIPFTYFTFEIAEVIKGDFQEKRIELGFMGGAEGNTGIQVADMEMPEVGESGIYFVKSIGIQHVHPLSGWHQGHYLIVQRAHDRSKVVLPAIQKRDPNRLSKSARLQSVEDFKQDIRKIEKGQ